MCRKYRAHSPCKFPGSLQIAWVVVRKFGWSKIPRGSTRAHDCYTLISVSEYHIYIYIYIISLKSSWQWRWWWSWSWWHAAVEGPPNLSQNYQTIKIMIEIGPASTNGGVDHLRTFISPRPLNYKVVQLRLHKKFTEQRTSGHIYSYAKISCPNMIHQWFDLFLILLCGGEGFLSAQQTWLCFVFACMEALAHLGISARIDNTQAPSLSKARRRSKRNLALTLGTDLALRGLLG